MSLANSFKAKEELREVILQWKHFWMNQVQNSEADRKNYFDRAFGIDSNMIWSLADLLFKAHADAFIKETGAPPEVAMSMLERQNALVQQIRLLRRENESLRAELEKRRFENDMYHEANQSLVAEIETRKELFNLIKYQFHGRADGVVYSCHCGTVGCPDLHLQTGDLVFTVSYANAEKIKKAMEGKVDEPRS